MANGPLPLDQKANTSINFRQSPKFIKSKKLLQISIKISDSQIHKHFFTSPKLVWKSKNCRQIQKNILETAKNTLSLDTSSEVFPLFAISKWRMNAIKADYSQHSRFHVRIRFDNLKPGLFVAFYMRRMYKFGWLFRRRMLFWRIKLLSASDGYQKLKLFCSFAKIRWVCKSHTEQSWGSIKMAG